MSGRPLSGRMGVRRLAAISILCVLLVGMLGGVALAQQPPQQPPAAAGADTAEAAEADPANENDQPDPAAFESSRLTSLVFWLFALGAIVGSIFVITRRNLITAVMGMVATFFAVAAVYVMLYAHFLAVIQILVYAGAIMVLFVFVIMILNRPEDEPYGHPGAAGIAGRVLAFVGLGYFALRFVVVLWGVEPGYQGAGLPPPDTFGTTRAVGETLFLAGPGGQGGYLFPFEAISVVLLIAVVGAIAIARPLTADESAPPTKMAGGDDEEEASHG